MQRTRGRDISYFGHAFKENCISKLGRLNDLVLFICKNTRKWLNNTPVICLIIIQRISFARNNRKWTISVPVIIKHPYRTYKLTISMRRSHRLLLICQLNSSFNDLCHSSLTIKFKYSIVGDYCQCCKKFKIYY